MFEFLGIAVGNANSWTPVLMIIAIQVMLFINKYVAKFISDKREKFTTVEKNDVLDKLAGKLLRASMASNSVCEAVMSMR